MAPKVSGQCPLVLLVRVAWWQGKTLGSEGKVMGSRLLGICTGEEAENLG